MPELDDAAIELRLRRVLRTRLGELRLDLDVHELERRGARRDTARRRQRILIGLGLAATMLVPVGWLMAGAPVPTTPMPADTLRTPGPSDAAVLPTTTPSATASLPRTGDFQAIAVRGAPGSPAGARLDVIAVRADGQERLVTQIPAASLPAGFRFALGAAVSSNGWLALGDLTAPRVVLVDLGPHRHPPGRSPARSNPTRSPGVPTAGSPSGSSVASAGCRTRSWPSIRPQGCRTPLRSLVPSPRRHWRGRPMVPALSPRLTRCCSRTRTARRAGTGRPWERTRPSQGSSRSSTRGTAGCRWPEIG